MKNYILPYIISLLTSLLIISFLSVSANASIQTRHDMKEHETIKDILGMYDVEYRDIIADNPHMRSFRNLKPGDNLVIISVSPEIRQMEEELTAIINQERYQRFLPPIQCTWELSRMARAKAMDMRDQSYFDHDSIIYNNLFYMLRDYQINYTLAGENLGKYLNKPREIANGWLSSSTHRANILSEEFTHMGIAAAGSQHGFYWTVVFMRP